MGIPDTEKREDAVQHEKVETGVQAFVSSLAGDYGELISAQEINSDYAGDRFCD